MRFIGENGLALIQKIPTPITPINIDKQTRHITLAYFDQKSTVDYIGAVQGIPVCFDAKECNTDTFPLANIHEHRVAFMENFEKQEGIFFLLSFTKRDEFYYLRLDMLLEFWKRAKEAAEERVSAMRNWTRVFPAAAAWRFGSVSGCTAEGFAAQGLTIILRSPIINRVSLCYHATIVAR